MHLKFRPSSHSEDWVIIATFNDKKRASETAEKIREKATTMLQSGKTLKLRGSSAEWGSGSYVMRTLRKLGAQKIKNPDSYQELEITITLPEKASINIAQLVATQKDLELINFLNANCKRKRQKKTEKGLVLLFRYTGPRIYDLFEHDDAQKGKILVDHHFIPVPNNFEIRSLF